MLSGKKKDATVLWFPVAWAGDAGSTSPEEVTVLLRGATGKSEGEDAFGASACAGHTVHGRVVGLSHPCLGWVKLRGW